MDLDGTTVGVDSPYFIAEAGVNHNGDLEVAKGLVDVAVDCGADAVKFQTFSADRLVTKDANKTDYQRQKTGDGSQYEMLKQYELDQSAHEELQSYCNQQGITFLSTPFDTESADMLAELGVPAIKLGSGELDNHPLLEHVAKLGIPMIVSTGMGTMDEVHASYDVIKSSNSDVSVIFLHCTSAYPCCIDDVNLRAMETMITELETPVGYSDHTTLPETPALAVAAGACVVEKHFTLDSTLPGPDHDASLEPDELQNSIKLVRSVSRMLGHFQKKPTPEEESNKKNVRKSIHGARPIARGKTIEMDDIQISRPNSGLSPTKYYSIIGKKVKKDIREGEPINEDMVIF